MADTFLILRIAETRLALPVAAVREVLPLLPIAGTPGMPRPLIGFVGLRGTMVPVLAPLLLLDPDAGIEAVDLFAHLVRLHGDDDAPCLLVDRVEDVAGGTVGAVDPGHSLNGVITGELTFGETQAHIVDPSRLLLAGERAAIARLAAAAAARRDQWAAA
jgi:purine-binding chemotaxis protein CheW